MFLSPEQTFAEGACESLLRALHVSDSWNLLEETATLLADLLPDIPKTNTSLTDMTKLLPQYGDGHVCRYLVGGWERGQWLRIVCCTCWPIKTGVINHVVGISLIYIPQQLVEDYEVKWATFPSDENSVFSETALAVFGPNCCRPQLLRLGTIFTGVCASTKMIRKVLLILHYWYTRVFWNVLTHNMHTTIATDNYYVVPDA